MIVVKGAYYVKSFEEDFCTKTLINNKKVSFQNVFDIVKKKLIKPHTKSFGEKGGFWVQLLIKTI